MATQLAPLPTEDSHTADINAASRTRFGIFVRLVCVFVVALVGSEIFCRLVIGLGDPPLYVADPKMEYLLQPSKTYYRFHKRFAVNQYSMRSDDFPAQKSGAGEFEISASPGDRRNSARMRRSKISRPSALAT